MSLILFTLIIFISTHSIVLFGQQYSPIENVSFGQDDSSTTTDLFSNQTKEYLREQFLHLNEQFSSLTLSTTDHVMRKIYSQSLETFIIEKRNLSELVNEMANYTNRAIMKKLEAIINLVNISEHSYRRFAETDEETRNATAKFMSRYGYFSSKHANGVAINATYENISSTTTASILTQSMTNISEITTETPVEETTGVPHDESSEYESDHEYRMLEKDLLIQQKKHFGGAFVNTSHSTVHVPTIIYSLNKDILLSANWSYNLNQAFIDNYGLDPELTWQYFCSQTGLYRVWPGHIWEYPEGAGDKLDLFDCRVQNWYIRATSSPRDVIILIDASGSMTGLKKSIAIQTVETILDTLSDDDFVQIIKFQEEAEFIDDCFQDGLVQATFENRHRFRTSVNDRIVTKEIANFSKALNMAFDILDDARINISRTENARLLCQCHYLTNDNQTDAQRAAFCPSDLNATPYDEDEPPFLDSTGCNKMIMIVTDGATETALNVFQSRNWLPNNVSTCHPIETRVFTYMIGRELGDPKHIRWMSCANKGYFAHVSTLEDIQENVEDYIPVTARPIAMYNDHVTVWSSVFLDVERTLPIKTYKWFPFKFTDLSISMDEFKNKSKPVNLMISIAQPVLNPPQLTKDKTNLLGAVGVDIPVKLLQEFSPKYRLGVHAYAFMINHNGYLMFHPDLRPVLGPYRKQNYHSIDLDMVEIPENLMKFVHPLPSSQIQQIRKDMVLSMENRRTARVKKHLDDMRRIEQVEQHYFYATLGDKESNPFSLGIVLRFPYGQYHVRTKEQEKAKVQIALRFILQQNVRIADWIYCNSTAEDDKGDTEESFRGYLKEKIETEEIISCPYKASKQLIDMMIEELYIMSKFENWTKTGRTSDDVNAKPLDPEAHRQFEEMTKAKHVHWVFLGTRSGITAYWRLSNLANEHHIRQFGDLNPNSIESSYYERTINATYFNGADNLDGDFHVYSLFYGINTSPGSSQMTTETPLDFDGPSTPSATSQMYLLITTGIWMNQSSTKTRRSTDDEEANAPFGVFGVMSPYRNVRQSHFSRFCEKIETGVCYIVDENGYIMFISEQDGIDRTEDVGKFLGEFEGAVMQDLIAKKIFSEFVTIVKNHNEKVKMVDFQGVCLRRTIRYEKSSAERFHGFLRIILTMFWRLINHLTMSTFRDIVSFPWRIFASDFAEQTSTSEKIKFSTTIRESLSNILLTFIDFRSPILDSKRYNRTRDDETIERVPESCIEEFNLYVSTWKGWQGEFPSKTNRIRWDDVERENTIQSSVTCTHTPSVSSSNSFDDLSMENQSNFSSTTPPIPIAESFSYSITKLARNNLMLLYVNHSKESSHLCPKLIIKRKPVEFTAEEWCTRLKTTPYRERPHKCFFVHDGETRSLFPKCSFASFMFASPLILLIFLMCDGIFYGTF